MSTGLCCVPPQSAFLLICFHSNFCQSQANSQQNVFFLEMNWLFPITHSASSQSCSGYKTVFTLCATLLFNFLSIKQHTVFMGVTAHIVCSLCHIKSLKAPNTCCPNLFYFYCHYIIIIIYNYYNNNHIYGHFGCSYYLHSLYFVFYHHSPYSCCLTQCLLTILVYIIPLCYFSRFHGLFNHHHHSLHTGLFSPSLLHLLPVQLQEDPLTWINAPITNQLPQADMMLQ